LLQFRYRSREFSQSHDFYRLFAPTVRASPEDEAGAPNCKEFPLTPSAFAVRPAVSADVADIHTMIGELAAYEKLSHLCVASEADLAEALFGPRPAAEALIARSGAEPAGFALFFHTYSTFLGRRSLWLEDLFVRPAHRRKGCARALLRTLAAVAVARRCGRFEWAVLDWNAPAIAFYEGLGAAVLPDWRIVRVVGPALTALAAIPDVAAPGR
jgi:GNAT superfamily N-acetyltransferase